MKRLFTLALLLCLAPALADAQPAPSGRRGRAAQRDAAAGFKENPAMLAAFRDVVAGPSKSVVRVQCDGEDAALGTVVSADGYILTKNSELTPGALSCLTRDGFTYPAKVVSTDSRNDLALLKVAARDLVPVAWADSKSAAVGDLLAAPGTADVPVAVGVLSVAARTVRPRDLPSSTPPANAGFLGVGLEEAEGGARIMQVIPNSAALKAGLRVDDIVTLIADTQIIDSETMVNTIQHHKPGEVVTIKIRRGGQHLEVKATLDKRPPLDPGDRRRDYQNRLGSELSNRRGGFAAILQHDMVIKPSDCGGPVVNLDGKAVGINIARAGRTESYAIPAETIQALLPTLKSGAQSPTASAAVGATTRPTR